MEEGRGAGEGRARALRRMRKLSLHLAEPRAAGAAGEGRQVAAEPCAMAARAPRAGKFQALASYMRDKHWDLQEKVVEFFNSRPDLQTPVEISTAEHRELCMRQLRALVREANIRPFRLMLDDPGRYFAVMRAVGSVDMSLGVKMGVQCRFDPQPSPSSTLFLRSLLRSVDCCDLSRCDCRLRSSPIRISSVDFPRFSPNFRPPYLLARLPIRLPDSNRIGKG